MLKGIVEQNDVGRLRQLQQLFDAMCAFFVHSNDCLRKFAVHLKRFIANIACGGVCVGHDESARTTFVAAAEHGHAFVGKMSYQVFGVRRFACAADGDVADADNRQIEFCAVQQAAIETCVAPPHDSAKQFCRQK